MTRTNEWKRAHACSPAGDNCVEVNLHRPGLSSVRDSKRADGAVLTFEATSWADFTRFLRHHPDS
ncbi:DUF397 domain-containing protein [Lentzea sp. NPDC006480]|uniref:DUF397 domain-containing protein n=1 Tax=Lentzea sp. NPDC006480 TaxID=3157176 RepID=UPI0033A88AC1